MDICDKCGLPKDLCICKEIAKEQQIVRISTVKRRFGKITTIIEGLDGTSTNLKELAKELKAKCACGGTVKEGRIELQGNQKNIVRKVLREMGYTVEGED
ncbi:MAG: stress response translation initiation inhibitor YciH [Canidatus Methanoxibalbensis ujae]|nr:stress response translation initiation inhibitor YciH [Candidatus Methanoxibalbensis ujae]MCW7078123.1 stress response translation initiation inhibitor YciH [Candidatus Methanoxibalbensis ujae]RLG38679.1 MAG: stress response translation initiation inhibitor YciH [Methanosarcinales archaeon]